MTGPFVAIRNARATAVAGVPRVDVDALREGVAEKMASGARISAMFAVPGDELWVVLADPSDNHLLLARSPIEGGSYPAFTPLVPAAHLFERALWERWGVIPDGHPWLRPVRFGPPAREGVAKHEIGQMDFYRVEGEEVHEVAVGPIHAGVIEPAHFRFQCHGEEILNLEISLGYQHRGVQRALIGGPSKTTLHLAETVAGDTTIGHATACCQLLEALAESPVPPRALALRGIALELERLANHTGDLGALAGDVGYLPTASFCGRLRGDWLNLTAELCGNRFGRSFLAPGGVRFPVDADRAEAMIARAARAQQEVASSVRLLWDSPRVMARFEDTGAVAGAVAREIGLVGVAARASGLLIDARVDLPTGIYQFEQIPLSEWESGDVFARAWVRSLEIERSAAFVEARLAHLPDGPERVAVGPPRPEHVAVAVVEGWRGELCHVAITGPDSRFRAYEIVDPSFHNWMGVALANRGGQISDFPLCNKSFNLSYCGFDL